MIALPRFRSSRTTAAGDWVAVRASGQPNARTREGEGDGRTGSDKDPRQVEVWRGLRGVVVGAPLPRRGVIVARAGVRSRSGLRPALRAPLTGLP
jgi:hypothetical protein